MAGNNAAVSVLTPNGRRQTVRVSPNTSLLQVLEEVCSKHGFTPDSYGLKFQRTVLDLSLQWRFCKLPNNAKLEMVTSERCQTGAENKVRIAVQLDDGRRFQEAFCCGQNLWELLNHFPELRISEDDESTPTCVYMRDEITGKENLQKTSLRSLGLTGGNAIIRYVLRKAKKAEDDHSFKMSAMPTDDVGVEQPAHAPKQPHPPKQISPFVPTEHNVANPITPAAPLANSTANNVATSSEIKMDECTIPTTSKMVVQPVDISCHSQSRKATEVSSHPNSQDAVASESQMSTEEPKRTSKAENDKDNPKMSQKCQASTSSIPNNFVPFSGQGRSLGSASASNIRATATPSASSHQPSPQMGPPQAKKPKSNDEIEGEVNRQPLVYHMDSENNNMNAAVHQDLPDEFFEVTMDDVRKRLAQLKSQRKLLEEAPLMTSALREAHLKEKMDRYPLIVIRVLFPDRHILQGFFKPLELVAALRLFVKSHLEDPGQRFNLFITPPKTILEDSATLFEAGLFPAALVYFGSDGGEDMFLKQNLLESSVSADAAGEIIAQFISKPCSPVQSSHSGLTEDLDSVAGTSIAPSRQAVVADSDPESRPPRVEPPKMPKWLKLSGKK